jgi:putative redox protein
MAQRSFDFEGADGQKLSGLLDLPEGQAQAYALFAHCFTCTKNSLAAVRIARALTARGFGVLRFDFTGLGQSGGDFGDTTFSGNVQDLVAAAGAMAAAGMAPRLLIGHSLGGAAVLAAAGDLPGIKAVATIAAPFDVGHVTALFGDGLQQLMEQGEAQVNLGGRPFMMRRSFIDDLRQHDQGARIAQLHRALLVMHAPRDATVGIDNAGMIFQAARHPKSFVTLDDADHLLTRPADAAYAADVIAAWASRYIAQPAEDKPVAAPDGRVVVEETGAGRFQVAVRAGAARFLADEPVSVGGLGSGPSPYDLLAAGLGACTAMTLRLYAAQKNWPLAKVRVAVDHSKAKDRDPPDLFTREITIAGDLDEAQRARLMEIADRCPVHRTLEHGAKVATVAAMAPSPPGAADHVHDMERACEDC